MNINTTATHIWCFYYFMQLKNVVLSVSYNAIEYVCHDIKCIFYLATEGVNTSMHSCVTERQEKWDHEVGGERVMIDIMHMCIL